MDNLSAILTPSKAKDDTAVDISEEDGERYSSVLTPKRQARDVELQFALYQPTKAAWLKQYMSFINFLREGEGGWFDIRLPQIGTTLHVKYSDSTKFTPLTYLWEEGVQAARFKVTFREPQPIV